MPRNRLEDLRKEQSLSQQRVANALGVNLSTVSRWERGLIGIPDWRKAQLAELLGVSVPFLMGWADGSGGIGRTAA